MLQSTIWGTTRLFPQQLPYFYVPTSHSPGSHFSTWSSSFIYSLISGMEIPWRPVCAGYYPGCCVYREENSIYHHDSICEQTAGKRGMGSNSGHFRPAVEERPLWEGGIWINLLEDVKGSALGLVAQCPTLCHPVDWSPPVPSVHGILQARILEWVAVPSSELSSRLRDWNFISYVSCISRQFLYHLCHMGSPNARVKTWISSTRLVILSIKSLL